DVTVSTAVVDGAAVAVLLQQCRDAHLLVVGDRGLGGITGLLLGSVAVQTVTHADCPVLVVRGHRHADGPVVVGVDGSQTSAAALRFAAAEAEARGSELVAVHSWTGPVSTGPGDMLPLVYDPLTVAGDEQVLLAEAVAAVAGDHPDVVIRQEVVRGPSRKVLVEKSHQAQLLVVGARGRGGFAGLILGSVSQHLMYHADCPTAVVRHNLDPA
ncbi:MAG TPA: universal stress protein, partial [Actinoplanes sp.]|nr:universal stress protein [Actinoplanes sp.]